jgi:hypothetical protein
LFDQRQELLQAGVLEAAVVALQTEHPDIQSNHAIRFLAGVVAYDREMNRTPATGQPDWAGVADMLGTLADDLPSDADVRLGFYVHNQAFLACRNAGSALQKAKGDPQACWDRCSKYAAAATTMLNRQTDVHDRDEEAGYFYYNLSRHVLQNEGRLQEALMLYRQAGASRFARMQHLESIGRGTDASATQTLKVPFDESHFFKDAGGNAPIPLEEEQRIAMTYCIDPKFFIRPDKEGEWQRRYPGIPYPQGPTDR